MLYFTENLIAKSRKIDTEVAESSTMFASITQSDDEGDSSFEFVKNESMSDEPYTSQLRTPPKLNDTLDDSVDEYLGISSSRIIQDGRHDSREVLFGDHEDEDNEDGSGGGSSAASTAADIMREFQQVTIFMSSPGLGLFRRSEKRIFFASSNALLYLSSTAGIIT